MSNVDLVGLVGHKGSGKDTAAAGLLENGWVKLALATPLRDIVQRMFLLSDEQCELPHLKEQAGPLGVSYRRAMQVVGTDLVRDQLAARLPELIPGGLWVNHMLRQVANNRRNSLSTVITDVRFMDEATAILAAGGMLVYIDREGLEEQHRQLGWAPGDRHSSETGVEWILDKYIYGVEHTSECCVLRNNESEAKLAQGLVALVAAATEARWDRPAAGRALA